VIKIPISTWIYWTFSWGGGWEGFHKSVQLTLSVTKSICVRENTKCTLRDTNCRVVVFVIEAGGGGGGYPLNPYITDGGLPTDRYV
jgi:hypothetical protein